MSFFKNAGMGVAAFGSIATAGFLSLTATGLLKTEDLRTNAYRDPIGIPTVCVGETRGVKMGDSYTREECLAMLNKRIVEFDKGLARCITVKVPEETRSAITQWAYNVGLGNACSSTLVRKLNSGQTEAACNELPKWVYAGGRKFKGLENRRQHEKALCLKGIGK